MGLWSEKGWIDGDRPPPPPIWTKQFRSRRFLWRSEEAAAVFAKERVFFEMLRRRLANCFGAIPRPCPGILPISLFFLFLSLGLVTGGGNCGGFFVRGRRRKRKKEKDRRGGRPVRKNRDRIILGRGIIGSVPALSSRP